MVASMVSRHSCGASGMRFLMTRRDLLQLVHEVHLGVQAAGGVDDHHVGLAGLGRREAVVDHRPRVAAALVVDHLAAHALAPFAELLHGRGPERVAGHQQRLFAQLLEVPGDLADGGGLAGAVDAHHEDHGRRVGHVDARVGLAEVLGRDLPQPRRASPAESLMLARVGLGLELLHDGDGGVDAHVGEDERFLDLLPQVLVEAVEQDRRELLLQGLAALGQAVAQLREPAAPLLLLPSTGSGTAAPLSTPMNTSDQL